MKLIKRAVVVEPADTVDQGLSMEGGARGIVDVPRFKKQWDLYCRKLELLGRTLIILPAQKKFPDSVCPEDPAVILQQGAKRLLVVTRLAHLRRQGEEALLERALTPYFSDEFSRIVHIEKPALIEGGDVLTLEKLKKLYVGITEKTSGRTNGYGAEQLARIARDMFQYETEFIEDMPEKWLHLKGGVTYHDGWSGQRPIITVAEPIAKHFEKSGCQLSVIPEEEHDTCYGANGVSEGRQILIHEGATRMRFNLERLDFGKIHELDLSEPWKKDTAMSCLSKEFEAP